MAGATGGESLYEQVTERLRDRILDGTLAPGERLKGEQELGVEFGVSRLTIRRALGALQDEGLLLKRQGLGSFVRPPRVRQVLARLETLDETLSEHGLAPQPKILEYAFRPPSEDARRALALARGADVLFVRRVHTADTGPIAVALLSVPASIGERISRRDLETQPIFEVLPRLGLHTGRAVQSIRAESAPGDVAAALDIEPGTAALVCERITYSTADDPIVHAVFYYRADRFEFRANLSGHTRDLMWALPGLAPLPSPPLTP